MVIPDKIRLNNYVRLRELHRMYYWLKYAVIGLAIINFFSWLTWLSYYFKDFRP